MSRLDIFNPTITTRLYTVECSTWDGGYAYQRWSKAAAMECARLACAVWPLVCIVNNWTGKRLLIQNKLNGE